MTILLGLFKAEELKLKNKDFVKFLTNWGLLKDPE